METDDFTLASNRLRISHKYINIRTSCKCNDRLWLKNELKNLDYGFKSNMIRAYYISKKQTKQIQINSRKLGNQIAFNDLMNAVAEFH